MAAVLVIPGCGSGSASGKSSAAETEPKTGTETEAEAEMKTEAEAEAEAEAEVNGAEETEAAALPEAETITGQKGSLTYLGAQLIEINGASYIQINYDVTALQDSLQEIPGTIGMTLNDSNHYRAIVFDNNEQLAEYIGDDADFAQMLLKVRTDMDVSHEIMMPNTTVRKIRYYPVESSDPLIMTLRTAGEKKEITLDPANLPGLPEDDFSIEPVGDPEKWLDLIPNVGRTGTVYLSADKADAEMTIENVEYVDDAKGYGQDGKCVRVTTTVKNLSDAPIKEKNVIRAYQWVIQNGVNLVAYSEDRGEIAPGETNTITADYIALSDSPVIVTCGYFEKKDLFGDVFSLK